MIPRLFLAGALALVVHSAEAQFANNTQRDAYIAALAAKVNAQTLWIRQADAVIRDLRCALDAAVDALAKVATASGTCQPVEVTIHAGRCGAPGEPEPKLGAMP